MVVAAGRPRFRSVTEIRRLPSPPVMHPWPFGFDFCTTSGMPLCLIVEDHGDTRDGYAEYLSLCGFDVLTAEDGAGFRTVIDRVIPDVVVMDIQLPHADGWQLTAELRSKGRTRHIPIVIVSARVQAVDRERSFREGCDAFLGKPCDPHDLVDQINRLLTRDSLATGDRATAASTQSDSP